MGANEVHAFLSHLAVEGDVAASTQNQALNAIVFLYKHVLKIELGDFSQRVAQGAISLRPRSALCMDAGASIRPGQTAPETSRCPHL